MLILSIISIWGLEGGYRLILVGLVCSFNPVILTLVQEADSKPIVIINGFYKTISFISTALATLIIGQGAD